jgi:hypothetical protein
VEPSLNSDRAEQRVFCEQEGWVFGSVPVQLIFCGKSQAQNRPGGPLSICQMTAERLRDLGRTQGPGRRLLELALWSPCAGDCQPLIVRKMG